MKILVSGGAGFIGSHLAEYLLASGHDVTVLDDLSSGKRENVPSDARFFRMRCQDITEVHEGQPYDFVYHLASTVGVSRVVSNPTHCIENIIDSTNAVLSMGVPGIYFSTSEVYGKNLEILREDSDCILSDRARWNYAAAKLCGEWMARQAGWKVVRLFNVVGPRQNPAYGHVFPNFTEQAMSNKPMTVYGDGSQIRTFIDVRDCVEILDILRDKPFDVVNIGGPLVISIVELARRIKQQLKSRSEIRFVQNPIGKGFEECDVRIPDLKLLGSLIGKKFKYRTFEETIDVCQPSLTT